MNMKISFRIGDKSHSLNRWMHFGVSVSKPEISVKVNLVVIGSSPVGKNSNPADHKHSTVYKHYHLRDIFITYSMNTEVCSFQKITHDNGDLLFRTYKQ